MNPESQGPYLNLTQSVFYARRTGTPYHPVRSHALYYILTCFIAKSNAFCHFYRKIQCVRKRLHIYSMSIFLVNLMLFFILICSDLHVDHWKTWNYSIFSSNCSLLLATCLTFQTDNNRDFERFFGIFFLFFALLSILLYFNSFYRKV